METASTEISAPAEVFTCAESASATMSSATALGASGESQANRRTKDEAHQTENRICFHPLDMVDTQISGQACDLL
jgi:hypothetical protein